MKCAFKIMWIKGPFPLTERSLGYGEDGTLP